MTVSVDPLRQLRPIREEELNELVLSDRVHQAATAPVLAYDVYRTGDDLVIEFDVPGVDPSDVNVAIEDRSLVVEVSRKLVQGRGVDVIEAGRQHGAFSNRLFLGERWNLDSLRASVANGVLTVRTRVAHQIGRRTVFVDDTTESTASEVAADRVLEDSLTAALAISTSAA
jgi:HSP20 family protein